MYDKYFYQLTKEIQFNPRFDKKLLVSLLEEYRDSFTLDVDQETWFNQMKEIANTRNFAKRAKDYQKAPESFIGHIGEYAEIIRVATCAKTSTPNFYDVLRILGKDKIVARINHTIALLKN